MTKRWTGPIALTLLALSLLASPAVAADDATNDGTRVDAHLRFLNETLFPDTNEAGPARYEWLTLVYG